MFLGTVGPPSAIGRAGRPSQGTASPPTFIIGEPIALRVIFPHKMNTVARLAKEAAAASPADSIPVWCRNSLPPACHSDPIELVEADFGGYSTPTSLGRLPRSTMTEHLLWHTCTMTATERIASEATASGSQTYHHRLR